MRGKRILRRQTKNASNYWGSPSKIMHAVNFFLLPCPLPLPPLSPLPPPHFEGNPRAKVHLSGTVVGNCLQGRETEHKENSFLLLTAEVRHFSVDRVALDRGEKYLILAWRSMDLNIFVSPLVVKKNGSWFELIRAGNCNAVLIVFIWRRNALKRNT